MSKPEITFGADPEYFAVNRQENLIPAWELGIHGEKGSPEPILSNSGKELGGVLIDGVAVEFNVPPEKHFWLLSRSIRNIVSRFSETWPGLIEKNGIMALQTDALLVQKKYHSHPRYKEIGCSVDLDAYSDKNPRTPPNPAEMGNFRFTGGHIHIGCDPWPDHLPKDVFIKFMDIIYFQNALGITNFDSPRVKFYGMPGIWRETSYGVEYRSPVASWPFNWSQGSCERIQQQIYKILIPKNAVVVNNFVEVHDSGILEKIRNQVLSGGGFPAVDLRNAYNALTSAMSPTKLSLAPVKIALSGYKRELADGVLRDVGPVEEEEGGPQAGMRVEGNQVVFNHERRGYYAARAANWDNIEAMAIINPENNAPANQVRVEGEFDVLEEGPRRINVIGAIIENGFREGHEIVFPALENVPDYIFDQYAARGLQCPLRFTVGQIILPNNADPQGRLGVILADTANGVLITLQRGTARDRLEERVIDFRRV